MTARAGRRIQFALAGIAGTSGYIGGGTVRLLGVPTAKRSPVLPDEPTMAESAVPGFESAVWFGLFAPAGTPKAVIELLNCKVNAPLAPAEDREEYTQVGPEPVGSSAHDHPAQAQAELRK